ncbi:hypothetical protein Q5752_000763 [Cryptotrichosporon argae]
MGSDAERYRLLGVMEEMTCRRQRSRFPLHSPPLNPSNQTPTTMVKAIESFDEFKALIAGSEPVVVDYWATWCGPCKLIGPHFAKLEAKYPGVKFAKVDVEEQEQIAKEQNIRHMPTFIAYKNGAVFDSFSGAMPAKLTALLDKVTA